MCRGSVQSPPFAPGSSKVAAGYFGLLVAFVQNLPQLHFHTVIFSLMQSFCILLLKERWVQTQALQHCSRGSQLQACPKEEGGQWDSTCKN